MPWPAATALLVLLLAVPAAALARRAPFDNHTGHALPNIVGVCCVGAGTTSLANYMTRHPAISWGKTKEHRWFRYRAVAPEDPRRQWPPGPSAEGLRPHEAWFLIDGAWQAGPANTSTAPGCCVERLQSGAHARHFVPGNLRNRPEMGLKAYAMEFPADAGTLGLDFDPIYLAGGSAHDVVLANMRAQHGPDTHVVALFRDPAEAACKRFQSAPRRRPPPAGHRELAGGGDDEGRCLDALEASFGTGMDPAAAAEAAMRGGCNPNWVSRLSSYCYAEWAEKWVHAWGLRNVHLLASAALADEATRRDVVDSLVAAFGLPPHAFLGADLARRHNTHERQALGPSAARCEAAFRRPGGYFSRCNARLSKLTGTGWDELWGETAAAAASA